MFISVALCTYNGERFLKQQLQSIFQQSMPIGEVVICDDGSTDSTFSIINSFEETYPGIITLHINETNLGVVKNFEKAFELCKGDIIFLCDQDDVWRNDKVEKCVNFFKDNPGYYAVFSDAALIDDAAHDVGCTLWEVLQFKEVVAKMPDVNIYKHIIFHANVVTGACMAIRKEAVPLFTPIKKIKDIYHDEWIALKLAPLNRIYFLNDTLTSYRLHSAQQTNVIRHKDRVDVNAIKKAIIFGNKVDGLTYYRYWKRRLIILQVFIDAGLDIDKSVMDEIIRNRKKGLLEYYKTLKVFNRKKVLFHNWVKREENILLSDVLFS